MLQVLLLTLKQFGILVCFGVIGFALKRLKVVDDAKTLSGVLVNVFLPAAVFDLFYRNFTPSTLVEAYPYALSGVALLGVSALIAYPLTRKIAGRINRGTVVYSLIVTNMTYVGLPLIKAAFPDYELLFMVFVMGFQVYIFTFGMAMFKEDGRVSFKGLCSPVMIAMVLGMLAGLLLGGLNVRMPAFFSEIVSSAAACMSPVAMLVAGVTLARLPLRSLISGKLYLFALLRLVVLPAAVGGIFYLVFGLTGIAPGVAMIAVIYLALPTGLNSVIFAEAEGQDGSLGARYALVTHTLGLLTLPVVFAVASLMV